MSDKLFKPLQSQIRLAKETLKKEHDLKILLYVGCEKNSDTNELSISFRDVNGDVFTHVFKYKRKALLFIYTGMGIIKNEIVIISSEEEIKKNFPRTKIEIH